MKKPSPKDRTLDMFSAIKVETKTGPVTYTTEQVDPAAVEALDDYDDRSHLHLVDPPRPAPTVIVEAVGENFEVSRLRDNGTTVACVMWTRAELEELRRRIDAALEMK